LYTIGSHITKIAGKNVATKYYLLLSQKEGFI